MKRLFRHVSQNLILWVIVWSVAAYSYPRPFISIKPYLEYFFTLTMLCVGLLLNPQHVRMLSQNPQRVGVGTLLQFTIMPATVFSVSIFFDDPLVKTGIILTGCVPGAMASNLMSALAEADVALSVSITTLSTLLSPLVTPFLLYVMAGSMVKINFSAMCVKLMWMVVLPVIAGYILRLRRGEWALRGKDYFSGIAGLAIVVIVAIVVASNSGHLKMNHLGIVLALLVPNIIGYAAGFGFASLFGWPSSQRRTVSLEVGMQNAGLGTVLALGYFGDKAAIPPAIYTVLCLVTSSLLVTYWERADLP